MLRTDLTKDLVSWKHQPMNLRVRTCQPLLFFLGVTEVLVWVLLLKQMILLNALGEPVPRPVYDYILRSQQVDQVYEMLRTRDIARSNRHRAVVAEENESMSQVWVGLPW